MHRLFLIAIATITVLCLGSVASAKEKRIFLAEIPITIGKNDDVASQIMAIYYNQATDTVELRFEYKPKDVRTLVLKGDDLEQFRDGVDRYNEWVAITKQKHVAVSAPTKEMQVVIIGEAGGKRVSGVYPLVLSTSIWDKTQEYLYLDFQNTAVLFNASSAKLLSKALSKEYIENRQNASRDEK